MLTYNDLHDLRDELKDLFAQVNSEEFGRIFWISLKDAAKVTTIHNICHKLFHVIGV